MKRRKKVMLAFAAICLIYLIFLQVKIYQASTEAVPKHASYLIVLGARVNGTIPSLALKNRIHTAARYLRENKDTMVIVSGGKGPGETISEAECMKRELTALGMEASRITMEDRSVSTYQNLAYSKKLLPDPKAEGIFVSNDFHIYRAGLMAEKQGLHTTGLPAKTPKVIILKTYLREYLAITKFYIAGS
ncbi:YdcF family protein [Bacillus sp. MUM 13]|uniref:YdcF family protein n=1 Tax=Bacillus sp. MUM 13 TaxID=1678001 RepID=UPI0008F57112|nr:YdcF family protein [Bacillus sp. MUM 13]OIK13670.1 cytoplasmic protein [Bacillus sp. MUM 13]